MSIVIGHAVPTIYNGWISQKPAAGRQALNGYTVDRVLLRYYSVLSKYYWGTTQIVGVLVGALSRSAGTQKLYSGLDVTQTLLDAL